MSESGIFKAAVKLSPDQRAAYLGQACGANVELRREVEFPSRRPPSGCCNSTKNGASRTRQRSGEPSWR